VKTRLSPEDIQAVRNWLGEYADAHKEKLFALLDPEMEQRLRKIPDPARRRGAIFMAMYGRPGAPALPAPTDAEFDRLREKLSEEARHALDTLDAAQQKLQLLAHWHRASMWTRMMPPKVSREELERFFAEELDPERRDELEKLPREQFEQQLRRYYWMHKLRSWRGGHRPPFLRRPDGRHGRYRHGDSAGRPGGPRPVPDERPGVRPPPRAGEEGEPPRDPPKPPGGL
jgi:hypothetical protein